MERDIQRLQGGQGHELEVGNTTFEEIYVVPIGR